MEFTNFHLAFRAAKEMTDFEWTDEFISMSANTSTLRMAIVDNFVIDFSHYIQKIRILLLNCN
jgi:hypothetical protein